jgi:hypothetical protein
MVAVWHDNRPLNDHANDSDHNGIIVSNDSGVVTHATSVHTMSEEEMNASSLAHERQQWHHSWKESTFNAPNHSNLRVRYHCLNQQG